VALAGFAVMSAVGGFAAGGVVLIASRFIKGVTAGFTAPAGLSIILASFAEGPLRHRALAIYSATGAAGFTFGLMCGGLLSEVTWRLVFFMPSVVAVITLVAAVRLIPGDPAPAKARQALDVPGAVSVTAAALLWSSPSPRPPPSAGPPHGPLAPWPALLFCWSPSSR
jgi:MFS family permease